MSQDTNLSNSIKLINLNKSSAISTVSSVSVTVAHSSKSIAYSTNKNASFLHSSLSSKPKRKASPSLCEVNMSGKECKVIPEILSKKPVISILHTHFTTEHANDDANSDDKENNPIAIASLVKKRSNFFDVCKNIDLEEATSWYKFVSEVLPVVPLGYKLNVISLAEGVSGKIYEVTNDETGDSFATKICRVDAANCTLRRDVKNECQIQRKLKHKNIVQVYGYRNTSNHVLMFMEFVPGGDLFEHIVVEEGIYIQDAFSIYDQILSAVEYCHSKNVVHLDIKPENVMLNPKKVAKLIDFGLAVESLNPVRHFGLMGTTAYAAPESYSQKPYNGQLADLFSLALTLLTVCSGDRAWYKPTDSDEQYVAWTKKQLDYPPINRLPTEMVTFLLKALSPDPSSRLDASSIRHHSWFRAGKAGKLLPVRGALSEKGLKNALGQMSSTQPALSSKKSATCTSVASGTSKVLHVLSQCSQSSSSSDKLLSMSQPLLLNHGFSSSDAETFNEMDCDDITNEERFIRYTAKMTRFFSKHCARKTMEFLVCSVNARVHYKIISQSKNTLLIEVPHPQIRTVFKVLLYLLAKSIMVDFRRICGDGMVFRYAFDELLLAMKSFDAVDEQHNYLSNLPLQTS